MLPAAGNRRTARVYLRSSRPTPTATVGGLEFTVDGGSLAPPRVPELL